MFKHHSVLTKTALLAVLFIFIAVPAISQSFYGSLVSVISDASFAACLI